MLPAGLDELCKTFKATADNSKGVYPHGFVNKNNIRYKGPIPPYEYYKRWLKEDDYNKLASRYVDKPWSMEDECLRYLKKDLNSLLFIMDTFNRIVFEKFLVNATKVSSYSALSKKIYLTCYYPKIPEYIPVISGYLENEIRLGYYGGIVDVVDHIITKAQRYDSNSHYPAAMLNDMPIGNPRLSDIKDLKKIFGFCYAKITAPGESELRVPILPSVDENGEVHCPRGVIYGRYFSEELKDVERYGYKVEVISSIIFDRGKNIFNPFVTDIFGFRCDAKANGNDILALIYKLILNSLYGKSGQLEITYSFEWMSLKDYAFYEKKHDTDLVQRFGEMVLVRDHGLIDPELASYIARPSETPEPKTTSESTEPGRPSMPEKSKTLPPRKMFGVKSSVSIAAAITAYARIMMNKYKNIDGNNYMGGDTDSAIMQHPLPDEYIGTGLGQMKYEFGIILCLVAGKKLYCVMTDKGDIIIKARGVGKNEFKETILEPKDFFGLMAGRTIEITKMHFAMKKDGVYVKNEPIKVKMNAAARESLKKEIDNILASKSLKLRVAEYIT